MKINKSNLSWSKELDYNNEPQYIVLHHAEASSCTIEDIHEWHLENGWAGCGYHYLVRKDGSIYTGRPESAQGAHCPGMNIKSIGICAEGEYMNESMPAKQKKAIIELCKDICNRYSIVEIGGHKQYYSTSCPGDNYPLDEIKSNISGISEIDSSIPDVTSSESNNNSNINISTDINNIQNALNVLKFRDENGNSLVEDGISGNHTIEAVKRCQEVFGLSIDGIAGNHTMSAINHVLQRPVLRSSSNDTIAIRYIQFRVGTEIDGIWGSHTEALVEQFQSVNGLTSDGIIGRNTWSTLLN